MVRASPPTASGARSVCGPGWRRRAAAAPGTTAVVTLTPFGKSGETGVCLAHEFRLGPTSPYYRLIFARSSTREKWPPKETGLLEAALKQAIGSNAQSANI